MKHEENRRKKGGSGHHNPLVRISGILAAFFCLFTAIFLIPGFLRVHPQNRTGDFPDFSEKPLQMEQENREKAGDIPLAGQKEPSIRPTQKDFPPHHREGRSVEPLDHSRATLEDPGVSFGPDVLGELIDILSQTDDLSQRRHTMELARNHLGRLPREHAVKLLESFLDSGNDFETDLPFVLGSGGSLVSHPSLRVAALDWLGDISPDDAFHYSKRIYDASESQDEWALALRNHGRVTLPGEDPVFSERILDAITNSAWLENPSDGFIESFDAIVFNQQYDAVEHLIDIAKSDSHLNRIAPVILDALVQHNRGAALRFVSENPERLGEVPFLRANLFTRADVRDNQQKKIVTRFVFSESISYEEKKRFAENFPSFDRFIGNRLLTEDRIFSLRERALIDEASLNLVYEWKENASTDLDRRLWERAATRLEPHVDSARRSGVLQ